MGRFLRGAGGRGLEMEVSCVCKYMFITLFAWIYLSPTCSPVCCLCVPISADGLFAPVSLGVPACYVCSR